MSLNLLGLPYVIGECEGSPREEALDRSGFSVTHELICAWNDRKALRRVLVGGISATGVFTTPFSYPLEPGMWCVGCTTEPFISEKMVNQLNDRSSAYEYAKVTAKFGYRTFQFKDGQIVAEEGIKAATIKSKDLSSGGYFFDAGKTKSAARCIESEIKGLEWSYRRVNITAATFPTIIQNTMAVVDMVNNAVIRSPSLGITFQRGMLRYQPGDISLTMSSGGGVVGSCTCLLIYNPYGWNKAYDPIAKAWGKVYNAAGEEAAFFEEGDFSKIVIL